MAHSDLPRTRFDVQAYTQTPYGPARSTLASLGEPVSPEVAQELQRLGSVMQETYSWLSKVLVTFTHKEARITAFLSTWAYERYWMGDALLALAGSEAKAAKKSRGALLAALLSNVHGHDLTAFQAAQLLIDCWISQALLQDLSESSSLKLALDIQPIVEGLQRQEVFFSELAQHELAERPSAQRYTRKHLPREVWPLNATLPQSRAMLRMLPDEVKRGISKRAQMLPGLEKGLRLRGLI